MNFPSAIPPSSRILRISVFLSLFLITQSLSACTVASFSGDIREAQADQFQGASGDDWRGG